MSLSEKAKTTEFEKQAYITELREYVLNLIDKLCFGIVATDHGYNRLREEAKERVEHLRSFLIPLETAQQLEAKIAEALRVLDEFDSELMLPIMGKPAVFRSESEYEKGETEGYYRMRKESLQVLNEIKKRLRKCLAGDETK